MSARRSQAAPTAPADAIPREQLELAWRHLNRPGWPPTLDAALAHHTYGICLRGLARNLRRGAWRAAPPARPTSPLAVVPPTPEAPPQRAYRPKAGPSMYWDGKRAAANDLD